MDGSQGGLVCLPAIPATTRMFVLQHKLHKTVVHNASNREYRIIQRTSEQITAKHSPKRVT